ncbi:MAG: phage minor capsid protein [Ruminococcus sp.]
MLSPIYYENCTDAILAQYGRMEDAILSAMVRRILKMGFVSDSTKHQAEMLQEAGLLYEDTLQLIADHTDATKEQVKALFEDAGVETVEIDNEVYRESGKVPVDIRQSDSMRQVLEAGFRKTMGVIDNLTSTTALTTQNAFYKACNDAYMQIASGAFSYQEAIRNVLKQAAQGGLTVQYPSGHTDKLDVAIRRAALTGVGQTCAEIGKMNAEENGCDLMEISAHSGARPSHAAWQGKLVSLSGKNTGRTVDGIRVLSLSDIGYGTGAGFRGWNCRHDWYPYFEGISTPNYTPEQLAELDVRNIPYNGKMYTQYEISQMQRAGERKVRALKRECIVNQTAADNAKDSELKTAAQAQYQASAVKLKSAEQKLKDFCNATGQDRDRFREQVLGFSRSEAQRAVQASKKEVDKYKNISYNKNGTIVVTDDWKNKGKVSVPKKYKPNAVVETATMYKNGNVQIDRTIYDENGIIKTQIHSGNHNKPKAHPYGEKGEHHHYYTWVEGEEHPIRETDNLTNKEKKEHSDIL